MERAGAVAVESQLVSVAQRHLQNLFGTSRVTRGDGCVLFSFAPLENETRLYDEVQRLCSTLVREVAGRTSLRLAGEDRETDFTTLKNRGVRFSKFLTDVAEIDAVSDELENLPNQPNVKQMIEVLYRDVVSDMKEGVVVLTDFPEVMCPTGTRLDVLVQRSVCVQAFSNTSEILLTERSTIEMDEAMLVESVRSSSNRLTEEPAMKIWINVRVLANAISSYSRAPIEDELPLEWRHKSFTLSEASEVLKLVHTALCAYWKRNAHSERTKVNAIALIFTVSGELREYLTDQLLLEDSDWRGPWRMTIDNLEKIIQLIKEWKNIVQRLLKKEWEGLDGGTFHDEALDSFAVRLTDALRIRRFLESGTLLLSGKLPDDISPEIIFDGESFTDTNRTPDERWAACVAAFEKEFFFIEDTLSGRLMRLLTSNQAKSGAWLHILQEHHVFLRRENIRNKFERDLETARDTLIEELHKIRSRYENNKLRTKTELQKLRVAKSCQAECVTVPERAAKFFGSSENLEKVLEVAKSVMDESQRDEQEVLAAWKQKIETQCKDIMEVSDAFTITRVDVEYAVCTLHPSIDQFLQEIRNMRSWCGGARLSAEAERTVEVCERLVTAATRSMQIVSNYNTVQRQMLFCTRPMLDASSSHALSQILYAGKESRVISIRNCQELEGLCMRFQNSVEALSNENRRIRRFHCEFISQVLALPSIDLARHMDQWRSAVDSMRSLFDDFLHTHRFNHYDTWRRHLDAQIYKALEYQYQRGLEGLHEKMEKFKVELVFKHGQIHFKPSIEALREAYYVKLREFVSIPLRFRGLQMKRESGSVYEMYPLIPIVNNSRIVMVNTKAMELFTRLNRVRKAFRSYMVVGACGIDGAPDIDTIVEEVCKTRTQFVEAFNVVKEQSKKMHLMEDTIQMDCFTISTIPVKASMEEQLHRLEESLLNAMRRIIQKTLSEIDDFVFNASNVITRQPTTMDDVGKANKAYYEFFEKMPSYGTRLAEAEEMNRALRLQSGTSIDFGPTKSRWEHLREAMASHHKIIDASVSKMRISLDNMILKHVKDGERFASKWAKQKKQLLSALKEKKRDAITRSLATLNDIHLELLDVEAQGHDLEQKCEYFKLPPPNFQHMEKTAKDIKDSASMWTLYNEFYDNLEELRKADWLTFRSQIYVFEDFIKEWRDKLVRTCGGEDNSANVKDPTGKSTGNIIGDEKTLKENNVKKSGENAIAQYLLSVINEWSSCVPLLRFVRGEGMMTEHWNEMFRLLEIDKKIKSAELTFGDILDHHNQLFAKEDELRQLHARAHGEVQIRDALQDLRAWALEASFVLITPTDGVATVKVKLITEWKEMLTQVSENQALISSLRDSPFYSHFADEISGWEVKFTTLAESLGLLNTIQRKWTYLEPLFARGALPQEQARFKRVDKEFLSVLNEVEADPRVMTIASQADIVDRLKTILEQIERCQKSLIEYLEVKRENFPRFYFISDDDMLEVLGHSKNPSVIQVHLKKLFVGIHSVTFSENEKSITHMLSSDKETVKLQSPVSIEEDNVEKWLVNLDECMKSTLRELLVHCIKEKEIANDDTIQRYPSQILQVSMQVVFARSIEMAIQSSSLNNVHSQQTSLLDYLTHAASRADPVSLLKIKSLILDVIHNIEVTELLLNKGVNSVDSWWWQKQLRYYMHHNGHQCMVHMMDTKFEYTYEYQGNAPRLVNTPLTEKCYLVLTKGMDLGYGGNPYGPAGTGKTESVKALGSAMGRQVLVFNCDEGIDFKAMGRIFIGIVKCGAWGCFDEFNRLKIDQLSAISQMIQVIQQAIKNREETCLLLNRAVQVNRNAGIFVTLNPAGKGYGGRTKLPDNLRQLFREIAMSVPDNELIASTMLLSEGFKHAKPLAKKVVELFRFSGQLLSRQQHYDWGLRTLKAVLQLSGSLMRNWKKEYPSSEVIAKNETVFIVQSLNINTLSKLTFEDSQLFHGLIDDIFPEITERSVTHVELEAAATSAMKELGLQIIPAQIQKVLQLYESMNQRMGVVLMGPSGSGKSSLLRVLRRALQMMGIEVHLHAMNPKAVPRRKLLGYMDPDTREWYDGILSAAAREVVRCPKEQISWILCDGDIDPEWVESLNSVLDDNRLLTLPNGVRMQFGSNVNFVFETHSLTYASPATVSRMGVILFSDVDISSKCAVTSILLKHSEERREVLTPLIDKYLISIIDDPLVLDEVVVPTTRMGLLNCCLSHVLLAVNEEDFVVSLVRAVCAVFKSNAVEKVVKAIYEQSGVKPISSRRPYDTYFDRTNFQLAEYAASNTVNVTPEALLSGADAGGFMVETVEVQRLLTTLRPLVSETRFRSFFLVGPEGCGKSAALQRCFAQFSWIQTTVLHCSAQTTSQHLTQKLEQLCSFFSCSTGRVLRPKEGERLVVILKNINLPKPDKYGTVELHAFLLQLIMYGGFYSTDLEWIGLEKVQFVGSMDLTLSAGRYPVTPRLIAVVDIVRMSYPTKSGLLQIYSAYFDSLLKNTNIGQGKDYNHGAELAQFVVTTFDKIRRRFEGEEHAHCLFCPRSITNWVTNILMYSMDLQTTLLAALANESSRIFTDCLARPEDRRKAEKILHEQLAIIGYAVPVGGKDNPNSPSSLLYYVSWFSEPDENGVRLLKGTPYDAVVDAAERALVKYGREFKELDFHLIPESVAWLTRVDRVLSRPTGHLIIAGRPGVGRRGAVCLASYLLRMDTVTINMMQNYGMKQFRNDLRQLITRATTQNERIVFILEDHNITDESILELINSLVSSGEVPGLFTPEELESVYTALREEAASDGHIGSITVYFLRRLRRNLRVALIMDTQHPHFLVRLQSNPGLLSNCDMLWMGSWSNDATRTICKRRLHDVIKRIESEPVHKGFHVHRELFALHEVATHDATPARFQTLMDTYEAVLRQKNQSSEADYKRLEAGLAKLHEGEASVETIQRQVLARTKDVEAMQKEADAALSQIQKKMEESKEQRDDAEELQTRLREEHVEIVQKRQKVEDELSGIKPSLDAAREAVSSIHSEQLNEIRSLKAPPEPIRDVLEAVLALLGVTDVSWQSMRKFLGERGAKERILEFDAVKVTRGIRENVSRLLHQKAVSFRPEVIHRASVAAAPMAAWVKAMVDYSTILERIAPLSRQLEQLENNQKEGEEKLRGLKKRLKSIDEAVETLRGEFTGKCKEAERLKDQLEYSQKELQKACDLLEKLSGEKTRWADDARRIEENNRLLPKQALVAAAFLTYGARDTEDVRQRFVKQWSDRLNFSTPMTVTSFMRGESDLLQWKAEGLPGDALSQENAIAMLDAVQTPLVIDPANQAMAWFRQHLKGINVVVEVTSVQDERFAHILELAVRFGKTLLVVDLDNIEPILYPILRRDLISAGAKRVVQVGNKQVDWQDTFRLVLFTRRTDLVLPPGAAALVLEVNFSVTKFGLENQLLGIAVQHELPELEKQRAELIKKEEGLKLELSKLEVRLLSDLAGSHGDLLANTALITALNDVKHQASNITAGLKQSHELQEELDTRREVYRMFASKGATMFFLVKDMEKVNRMYHFGLDDFVSLFVETLETFKGDNHAEIKIPKLTLHFAQKCFFHVSLGLLKQDRLVFGMHLVQGFFPEVFPDSLWGVFVGAVTSSPSVDGAAALPSWAPQTARTKFDAIATNEATVARLPRWRLDDEQLWAEWMQSASPEVYFSRGENRFPELSPIDHMLLVNVFRPDRLPDLTHDIILRHLQLDTIAPLTSIEEVITHGKAEVPIILITSSGADPSAEVQDIALRVVGRERFVQIALGGGQTDDAMQQLRRCAAQGNWLFLKNLHLVLDWAAVLEKELNSMSSPNPDFRLLITTEPHELFPTVLLRMSSKITVEAPPGVKQNLLQAYTNWDEAFLRARSPAQAQMLFGLVWFHALLLERRNYVPQGWVKLYDFSTADLKSATDVLCAMERKSVDWTTLRGLLHECIYGGRLENEHDERVLSCLISRIFTDDTLVSAKNPLHGRLTVPQTNAHAAVLEFIREHLPDADTPELLSLPPNADRAVKEQFTLRVCEDLRGFVHHAHTSASATSEAWRTLLVPVVDVWRSSGVAETAAACLRRTHATNTADTADPMKVFFASEVRLLADIAAEVAETYDVLKSVADGLIIPSEALRKEATELMSGRVLPRWTDAMDGPREVRLWIAQLHKRITAMREYASGAFSMDASFDLTDFLRPQTFLNALRQFTARSAQKALVDLVLVATIGKGNASFGVMLKGATIRLQGAFIDAHGRISLSSVNAPSSAPLSTDIFASWVSAENVENYSLAHVPLYTNAERTTTVLDISIPCEEKMAEKLLLAGAAAFLFYA